MEDREEGWWGGASLGAPRFLTVWRKTREGLHWTFWLVVEGHRTEETISALLLLKGREGGTQWSPDLPMGDVFQDPQWIPKTMDRTERYAHCFSCT